MLIAPNYWFKLRVSCWGQLILEFSRHGLNQAWLPPNHQNHQLGPFPVRMGWKPYLVQDRFIHRLVLHRSHPLRLPQAYGQFRHTRQISRLLQVHPHPSHRCYYHHLIKLELARLVPALLTTPQWYHWCLAASAQLAQQSDSPPQQRLALPVSLPDACESSRFQFSNRALRDNQLQVQSLHFSNCLRAHCHQS